MRSLSCLLPRPATSVIQTRNSGYASGTTRNTTPRALLSTRHWPRRPSRATKNRRRADRVIWAGLGRLPGLHEPPSIAIEFISKGHINRERDYVAKRAEYREIGVKEYWIIDRFAKTMTVCIFAEEGDRELVIPAGQTYATPLLPGYELPLGKLIDLANRWAAGGSEPAQRSPPAGQRSEAEG